MVKLRLVDASDDKSFTEEGAFRVVTYNVIIHILHLFYYTDTLKKTVFKLHGQNFNKECTLTT